MLGETATFVRQNNILAVVTCLLHNPHSRYFKYAEYIILSHLSTFALLTYELSRTKDILKNKTKKFLIQEVRLPERLLGLLVFSDCFEYIMKPS